MTPVKMPLIELGKHDPANGLPARCAHVPTRLAKGAAERLAAIRGSATMTTGRVITASVRLAARMLVPKLEEQHEGADTEERVHDRRNTRRG